MSLETDAGEWAVAVVTQEAEVWNDTFSNAPSFAVVASKEDKKKSEVVKATISTTGVTVCSESGLGIRFICKEPGYDAGSASTHPEMDSVGKEPASEKTLDAVSFNDTFTNTPIVIAGYEGDDPDNKGSKASAANITTTGCDVACEFKGDTLDLVTVFAIYTNGFWEV